MWSGLADWRAAHPKATLSEIEAALDERLDRLRARLLADVALASVAADPQEASREERPRYERCGVMLQSRGQSERTLLTQGGAAVLLQRTPPSPVPGVGTGLFPWTMNWICCREG